ncbi:MAG: arsenate reductase ArsC [Rhodospirillales bacterium]
MPERMPGAVLFACTNNIVRSTMAEALLKHVLGHKVYVDSAGVRAGEAVDPFAIVVMDELGIDVSRHNAKTFDDLEDSSFDLIVSLSPEAQHSAVEMTRTMACEVEFWPTLDATGIEGSREQRLEAFRQVRDSLMRKIQQRFQLDLKPEV